MSQVFSFEFCEMFKNTNFIGHLWTITSVHLKNGIYSEFLSSFYLSVGISCWYALNSCSLSCNIRKFVLQLLVNIILISVKQIKINMKKFSKVSRKEPALYRTALVGVSVLGFCVQWAEAISVKDPFCYLKADSWLRWPNNF